VNVFLAVLWKDLLTELRNRERVVAMGIFSLLVVVVFHFSLPGGATARTQDTAPGLLWVAWLFASILGFNRAFALELENDALAGIALLPCDRGWVFLGKAAANLAILSVVQILIVAVFALFFELELGSVALRLAGVVVLGSIGLCSVGTLFGAVAVRTRFREVMLPLLMLPLLIPVLLASVTATASLLSDGTLDFAPVQLLLVIDAIYLIVSFIGFDFVLDE